jgi:hypothetical protein
MSERETVVELPWAADSCPWVGKLRTVLPTINCWYIRDSAVQLVLTPQRVRAGGDDEGQRRGPAGRVPQRVRQRARVDAVHRQRRPADDGVHHPHVRGSTHPRVQR